MVERWGLRKEDKASGIYYFKIYIRFLCKIQLKSFANITQLQILQAVNFVISSTTAQYQSSGSNMAPLRVSLSHADLNSPRRPSPCISMNNLLSSHSLTLSRYAPQLYIFYYIVFSDTKPREVIPTKECVKHLYGSEHKDKQGFLHFHGYCKDDEGHGFKSGWKVIYMVNLKNLFKMCRLMDVGIKGYGFTLSLEGAKVLCRCAQGELLGFARQNQCSVVKGSAVRVDI